MRRPGTAMSEFGEYLWDHRISDRQFAEKMAKELKLDTFSHRTVEKWRYGKRIPNSHHMRVIKALTGISADSFLEGPKKETEPE